MVASFSNKPPPSIPSMPDFTMPPPGMPPMPPGFSAGKFYIVYTTMDTLDSYMITKSDRWGFPGVLSYPPTQRPNKHIGTKDQDLYKLI